ncbi:outer membrane protein assembly factor BamD [Desulfonatronovibrio hydrogenovorans]|uniref:outer membrane protein assembly factor BamD n=1 Tax=Desulfonatronovibrio hydrogenovorans TaxID=53245 RepID=UPI00048AE097|nr:outer membrane protein assembly factor BamD [Desulfonatronovibrio hydrogenovorans]
MKKLLIQTISILTMLSLWGCAFFDRGPRPLEDSPWELAQAGTSAMEEERYRQAIRYFSELKDRYPFSPHTPVAEVALGDAYFQSGNYTAAVNAYREFLEMNPRHELVPYTLFRTGLANFSKFKTVDRPQTHMVDALEYFHRVRESYPDSEYAEYAGYYIVQARTKMAEHELFVADFYWRTKRYGSAWQRYRYVVENFKDLPEIAEYASQRSKVSYYKFQKDQSRQKRDEDQGSWRDWFEWL